MATTERIRRSMKPRSFALAAMFTFALAMSQTVQATRYEWNGSGNLYWTTDGNWSSMSGSGNKRFLRSKAAEGKRTVKFNAATSIDYDLSVESAGTSDSAPYIFLADNDSYGLTSSGVLDVGTYKVGHLAIQRGTYQCATLNTGNGAGTSGNVLVIGGAGYNASLTSTGNTSINKDTLKVSAKGTFASNGDMYVGNNGGAGVLTLDGGSVTVASGKWLRLGYSGGSTGTGTVNLNGGVLTCKHIHNDRNGTVVFNGGTLKANSAYTGNGGFMQDGLSAKVTAKGGTIDTGSYDVTISAALSDNDASAPGGMKFIGGGSVTLGGSVGYTGGTTIAAGTTVKVDTAAKKDALLGSGVNTLRVIPPTTAGEYALITITGSDEFSESDLLKVSLAPGSAGAAAFSISNDKKSLVVNVPYAGGVINQSTPTLVFPGATLADLATHTLRARMQGDNFDADGTEVTFFDRQETMDGDTLANVTYQLQAVDETSSHHYTKAAKVEFTADANGVYAKLVEGNYTNYGNPAQFGNDPLTNNLGTSSYIPYDFRLVEPVNAISVNIDPTGRSGAQNTLDTTSSVRYGGGDYAVPYSAWSNFSFPNSQANATATIGGATITVSNQQGNYYCSNLSTTMDLRHGYIDDGSSKPNPKITVTNIPYEFYRIVVYMSSDTANCRFGYLTMNGKNYTASGDARSSDTVDTVEGAATWGYANAGTGNYLYGLKEGVNYLVSDVNVGSAATIVGHRSSTTVRTGIAAFQIVEYVPATYTATIGDGGAKTLSALAWDKTLPALLTAKDRIVVNVNEDTTLNIDIPVDVYGITFNVADGKTLTLSGNNIAAQYITATGVGQTVVASASQLAGTVKGDGTLVYGAAPSGLTLTDSLWSGVLWLKNGTMNGLLAQNLASANSTLRLTGVTGYFNDGDSEMTCLGTLELVDDGATPAFTVNNGFSTNGKTVFPMLTGDGTFKSDTTTSQRYVFKDVSVFTGTIDIPSEKNTRVIIGNDTSLNPANGTITVASGATATVAAGKTWTAQGGMVVDGTLMLDAGATTPAVVSGTGTVGVTSGTGTLNGYGAAAALTLATAPGATLAIVDAGLATMTVGAFNNLGTVDLRGTALTEATLNLASGVTAAATGTILYPATFQKFVVSPADQSVRSLADFSTLPTLPQGAAYYVTLAETREEFGKGSMTVADCAAGVNVRVVRPNGTSIDVVPVDGTATLTETPQIAGAATAFDATYTNTVAYAYRAPGWNAGSGQDVTPPTYNNTDNDETTGMYILHHPWVSGVMQNITSLGDFTLVVVGKMSPSRSTQFLHIGSSSSGLTGLLITTTENEDEVLIAKNTGNAVDAANGVKASVPNAATARHAYVINKKGTVFEVWVDGVKRGQFDTGDGFTLGSASNNGIQIGSDISGSIKNANIYKGVPNTPETETGVINVIRLFDYSITDAQAEAVFNTSPYVSQGGLYTRTVAADGAFSETDAWEKDGASGMFAVPEGTTVDGVFYNPSATLTVNAAAEIAVNANVALETLTVGGTAPVTFAADGTHTVTVVGAAIINSPVTNAYGALNITGAPLQLGSSGAICFDLSGYDISGIYETTRFQLTGLIDRDDEKVTFVPPAAVLSRTVSFGYNATGSCYEFTVTAERTAGTVYYKSGTYAEGSADLRIVTLDGEGNETETVLFPGDNVVFDDSVAGANAVVQFGETLPANVTFGFGEWTGRVIPQLPSSMYIWIGDAGDGKANTDGNWQGGSKPPAGAAVYIPSKTAAIDNDIVGFAPASITFGYGIGVVTIGGNAIAGVAAVTNLSATTHTFECTVAFADRIFVSQKAKGWDSRAQSSVRFAGGATGTTFADGTAHFLNGAYNLSSAEDWVANTYSDDTRWGIQQGSSLTVPSAGDTVELAIGQADSVDGGAFTAGVVRTSSRICYCCNAGGEYVVTNELVLTMPGADRHLADQYSTGAFKFEKVTLGDQGASKWFYFANQSHNGYAKNIWIGAGGLNLADGASPNTAYSCGSGANDVVYVRPWHSDYTIGTKPNSTADLVIYQGTEAHIGTDDEGGVARTVTCDGLIHYKGAVIVEGSGTFVVNNPGNDHSGTWTVTDTATVAVKPGSKTGTGAVTVNAGATLAVSESGTVAQGGALTLADGAALGFNFTQKKVAPVLDLTGKTVTVNGEVKVKVTAAAGIRPMIKGDQIALTSGGKFTGASVALAEGSADWAKGVSVDENGDIVLTLKSTGIYILVR